LPFCGGLNDPLDFPPFRNSVGLGGNPPVDLVISTPATIGPLGLKPKLIDMFADIQTLVMSSRYAVGRRQLENVLMESSEPSTPSGRQFGARKRSTSLSPPLCRHGTGVWMRYLEKKFPNANRITGEVQCATLRTQSNDAVD
jgi:hypothetical protein